MRSIGRLAAILMATVALAACTTASAYPGFDNPDETLTTFFESALKQDYLTTYDCYYDLYQQRVARDEFVKRRARASVLKRYNIDSLVVGGDSAEASVTLTFVSAAGGADRSVQVKENLVKQESGWKIRVW